MQPYAGIRTFLRSSPPAPAGTWPGEGNYDAAIIGVPFDVGTSNRPGARFGPAAIRDASLMLRSEHDFYTRQRPADLMIADLGDYDCHFRKGENINRVLDRIETKYGHDLISFSNNIITLGGDHTITLPILKALRDHYAHIENDDDVNISIVHFDAHVDTWDNGGHGSPFFQAVDKGIINPGASVQIGLRAPTDDRAYDFAANAGFTMISAQEVHCDFMTEGGIDYLVDTIKNTVGNNLTYLTFDIDCIDPSQAPGTGTPEVGGLFTWQVLTLLQRLNTINWIGMDVVEVAPAYDVANITSLAAATIIWRYLCILCERKI